MAESGRKANIVSVAVQIPLRAVDDTLDLLYGKDVTVTGATEMELCVPSLCGLMTNDGELVGLIGAEHAFVNAAGAALALSDPVAPGTEDEATSTALFDSYREVVHALYRLVNDFGTEQVHLDPDRTHSNEDLGLIVGAAERCLFRLEIDGYGSGVAGIWTCL